MWSYECVFLLPKTPVQKANGVSGIQMTELSKSIVADTGRLALQFALKELEENPSYELVGIIRRHAIITVIKEPLMSSCQHAKTRIPVMKRK